MNQIKDLKSTYTKNELKRFNCMGYAFGVELMMNPRGAEFVADWLDDSFDGEVSQYSVNCALDDMVDNMIEDYQGLEIVSDINCIPKEKEVMAFKFAVNPDDKEKYDFHFKVRRDGIWSEKLGDEEIRECELLPKEPWHSRDFQNGIWSDVVYLAWDENLSRSEINEIIQKNIDDCRVGFVAK